LISLYKGSHVAQSKPALNGINDSGKDQNRFQEKGSEKWPTNWAQQFLVLLRRDIKERRHESFSVLRVCQVLVVALISGLLWYKSDISHLQDQVKISKYPLFILDRTLSQSSVQLLNLPCTHLVHLKFFY